MIWVLVTTLFGVDPTVLASYSGMTSVQITVTSEFNSEKDCLAAHDQLVASPVPFGYVVAIDDCKIKERL